MTDTDWRVRSEALNVMGLAYYKQTMAMERAVCRQYNIVSMHHHYMGRASHEGSFYIDVGLDLTAPIQHDMDFSVTVDYVGMSMLFVSAMEHGVIEQTQGKEIAAASTVRMIRKANADGARIYRMTNSNKNSVLSQLQNFSVASKNELSALLTTSSDRILIPRNGTINLMDWTGSGYAAELGSNFRMIIGQGFNGGYSAVNDLDYSLLLALAGYGTNPAYNFGSSAFYDASYLPLATPMLYSWDPVEMASGAFVLDKSDLVLGAGEAPFGLSFIRSYHTARRFDDTPGLGYGWNFNGNANVVERSAPEAILGGANSYQMAPFAAAVAVAKDLHTNHSNAKQWATCALVVHWALEQMRYSAVTVNLGNQTIQFIRMPDGSYISPPGMKVSLEKSGSNYIVRERHGNTMTFDSQGRLSTIKNTSGATQTYAYNGSGRLSTITDSFGRVLTFTWVDERISSVSDGTGRSVSMGYTNGNLTSFTDPEGKVWTYQYDADHRMVSSKDPLNRTLVENDYDVDSRVCRQRSMGDPDREWRYEYNNFVNTEVNPHGGRTYYFHDPLGRSIGTADNLGNLVWRGYDGQDRMVFQTTPNGENVDWTYDADHNKLTELDPIGEITRFYYDAQHRLERVRDRRGKDTTFTYTAQHLPLTVTDPLNNAITRTYYGNGLPHTVTDGEGKMTTTEYDSWGGVNKIIFHDETFQSSTNNQRGDVLTSTDGEGRTVNNTWDKRRKQLTSTLASIPGQPAAVATNVYDDCGNLTSSTDANGNTTTYTWNALAKPLTTTLPALPAGNNVVTTSYDTRDWVTEVSNSLGHLFVHEYNTAHRLVANVDPLNRRTERTYDANGQVTQVKDPLNRISKTVWSERGEVVWATDAANKHTDSVFDENGNRTVLTNRRGKSYTFAFDDASRLTEMTTPTGKTTTTTYFDNNLLKTIGEPSGQT